MPPLGTRDSAGRPRARSTPDQGNEGHYAGTWAQEPEESRGYGLFLLYLNPEQLQTQFKFSGHLLLTITPQRHSLNRCPQFALLSRLLGNGGKGIMVLIPQYPSSPTPHHRIPVPKPHPETQGPPTPNPEGGQVLSFFFVNSPLITPAIPQSVCTVIVEFDAND